MPVKKYSPITPGTRFRVGNAYTEITSSKPEKSLLAPLKKSGGRNNSGKMTMRQKGGGHKRRYRIMDFKRNRDGVTATVKTIEYDPNRTAYIALVEYADGEKRYIIAPDGLQVGDTIMSGKTAEPKTGHAMFLADIPLGATIHAIEMTPGKGAALARSAGTNGVLMGREGKYAKRPRVRGVAMNPVDHPMGGGEGRASGGHPRSRTGIMAKGQKTRNNKKHSTKLIISKRKTKSRK